MLNYNMQNPMNALLGTAQGLQQLDANKLAMEQQRQQQQMKQQQLQASQQQQARIQELVPLIQQGDYNASIELASISPEISGAINQARLGSSKEKDRATAEWIAGYQSAPDKDAYLSQDNQMIDIDDQFRQLPNEQRDVLTKIVGAQVMPEQMFKATFQQSSAPQYTNVQFDEAGNPYGLNKSTGEYEPIRGGFIKGKATPQTVVNVGKAEGEQAKVIAKAEGENYNQYVKDAKIARSNDASLNQLEKLNEKAFEGITAPAYKSAAKLAKAIGIDVENLTETELFDSLSNNLVLGQTSKLTGVLTDKDMQLLATTVPQLSQTKEGRKKLIKIMKEMNNATKDKARLAAKFRKENNGQFDDMAFQEWLETQPKKDRISDIVGEQPQQRVIQAPQAAIQALMSNPNLAEQFRAKYGYLPEGM